MGVILTQERRVVLCSTIVLRKTSILINLLWGQEGWFSDGERLKIRWFLIRHSRRIMPSYWKPGGSQNRHGGVIFEIILRIFFRIIWRVDFRGTASLSLSAINFDAYLSQRPDQNPRRGLRNFTRTSVSNDKSKTGKRHFHTSIALIASTTFFLQSGARPRGTAIQSAHEHGLPCQDYGTSTRRTDLRSKHKPKCYQIKIGAAIGLPRKAVHPIICTE